MKAADIKKALKPLGDVFNGVNMYRDEPSPQFHYVSVKRGCGQLAIDAIKQAGGEAAWCPGALSAYSDCIQVKRP